MFPAILPVCPACGGLPQALRQQIPGVWIELSEAGNLGAQHVGYRIATVEQFTRPVELGIGGAPAPELELRSDGPQEVPSERAHVGIHGRAEFRLAPEGIAEGGCEP